MNRMEFTKAMAYLGMLYSKSYSAEQVSAWYEYFTNITEKVLKNAIKNITKKSKYAPTINELLEECENVKKQNGFRILEIMWNDGYFKKCDYGELSLEHQSRSYDKAMRWLETGIIPEWFKEDMKYYYSKEETKKIGGSNGRTNLQLPNT